MCPHSHVLRDCGPYGPTVTPRPPPEALLLQETVATKSQYPSKDSTPALCSSQTGLAFCRLCFVHACQGWLVTVLQFLLSDLYSSSSSHGCGRPNSYNEFLMPQYALCFCFHRLTLTNARGMGWTLTQEASCLCAHAHTQSSHIECSPPLWSLHHILLCTSPPCVRGKI